MVNGKLAPQKGPDKSRNADRNGNGNEVDAAGPLPQLSAGLAGNSGGNSANSSASYSNTAFIHKLYSMLEDEEMHELIWWSPSQTSFLIRPTERFSKALATYFKHTNVASFVRQLNMYGFHKVNDHKAHGAKSGAANKGEEAGLKTRGGQPTDNSTSVWEFKHSSAAFRRGDMESLKLIKRRSSRYQSSNRKNSASTVSTPLEPGMPEQPGEQQPIPHLSGVPVDMVHPYAYVPQPHSQMMYAPVDYFTVPPHHHQQQYIPQQVQQQHQPIQVLHSPQQQPIAQPPAQRSQGPPQGQHERAESHSLEHDQSHALPQGQSQNQHQDQMQAQSQSLPPGGVPQGQAPEQPQARSRHSSQAQPQQQQQQQQQQRPFNNPKLSDAFPGMHMAKLDNLSYQTQYEIAVEDLRNSNMDMIKLLDLVHSLVTVSPQLSGANNRKQDEVKRSTTPVSGMPASNDFSESPKDGSLQQQYLDNIMGEIARLKNSTLYRVQRSALLQQGVRPSSSLEHPTAAAATYPMAFPGRAALSTQTSMSSPALSQMATGHHASLPQMTHPMYYQPAYTPSAYPTIAGPVSDYYGTAAIKAPGASAPYLKMNPFEKKGSTSSSRNRNMSVLMDPLAPAPMSQSMPPISTSVSPNPLQQSAQQQSYYVSTHMPNPPSVHSRKNSKNDVKNVPTSNPDGNREIRLSDRRPLTPPVPDSSTKGGSKNAAGSAVNAVSYKPFFPYGTVPGAGSTSPMRAQHPQYSQTAVQGPYHKAPQPKATHAPQHKATHAQQHKATHAYPVYRGPSPLNPKSAEVADQEKILKPTPINPSTGDKDQEANTARREETTGSSSRLYALLNYDSKEQSSKKMKL